MIKTKKKSKPKEPVRYVEIDEGYGPREHWVRARVIREDFVKSLFDEEPKKELFVETTGGVKIWVGYWREEQQTT